MDVVITVAALVMVPAVLLYAGVNAQPRTFPVEPSVERLVDDLRRLARVYRSIERSDMPARAARLRAVTMAYDDTLRACCRALELPAPDQSPLSAVARLETEAALAQCGLSW